MTTDKRHHSTVRGNVDVSHRVFFFLLVFEYVTLTIYRRFYQIPHLQASMSRPFGVAMLFAGVDQDGAKLFHLDPSGTFIDCKAKSIGAASDGAEQSLKEQYHDNMSLKEALKVALAILKQVMEEKLNSANVEVVVIKPVKDSKGKCHLENGNV
ncbi:hypothetical protein Aduo_011975 [Ancylostoma duodenale]